MKLLEFEAKNILQKYAIATPVGAIASSPEEVELVATKIGRPIMLKSQVLVAGRGKARGIISASNPAEARRLALKLLGSEIKGSVVRSILVEEKVAIAAEFYASVAVDRQAKKYVVMASTSGGVDIEQVALSAPTKIVRYYVPPLSGFNRNAANDLIAQLPNLSQADAATFGDVIHTLYRIAWEGDAELVEINPLAKSAFGKLIACDARIIVDDNALFRHPELATRSLSQTGDSATEAKAKEQKLAYVELDGDIGIIGNGAGLVMATLDLVQLFGGKPANFLDIGGGAGAEMIKNAVTLVLSKPEVKSVLINIFGGVTRCDLVAQGIIQAHNESTVRKPLVVRMVGTNEEAGTQMLNQIGVYTHASMEEAIRKVTQL